ncbi:phage protein [Bifidobacterium dentium Bd1]|uniref:Phage protein n=1 Tax=Bifidobacterium dentium (strain ATCC 27534 / DSM 20436 / JCM 1195 / Bd1) TaxID=401473 RepID=D2QB81_BIFDB|nr:phage protein [Bifidobacterium dentium Bd1]
MTNAANSMYGASGYKGDVIKTDRPHGAVYPADIYSKRSNAKHNTLLKALSAGRG